MSRNVFLKMKSRVISRYGCSHSYLNSEMPAAIGKIPKLKLPMLSEHSSGLNRRTAASRSSSDIPRPPPVVMLITASVPSWIVGRKRPKTSGSGVGRPVSGWRACRCRIAAPASAAPTACSAISAGVMGRCGVSDGTWIAPVTAQLMIVFFCLRAIGSDLRGFWGDRPAEPRLRELDHLARDEGELQRGLRIGARPAGVEDAGGRVERRAERRRPAAQRVDDRAQRDERRRARLPAERGDDAPDRAPV